MVHPEILRIHQQNPELFTGISTTILDEILRLDSQDRLLINYHPDAALLADFLTIAACQQGVVVQRLDEDPSILTGYLAKATPQTAQPTIDGYVDASVRALSWATKAIKIVARDPHRWDDVDPIINAKYNTDFGNRVNPIVSNIAWWLKMDFPSQADALAIGMPYGQFADEVVNAWGLDLVKTRQGHNILINQFLNPGKTLEFCAGLQADGSYQTKLSMSIVGHKFISDAETVHNLPIGEVFSSPVRYTVEGRLVLPYPTIVDGRIIPNLALEFVKGRVVSYKVESDDPKHQEWLENVLKRHPDSMEVGEVGIGTNRRLTLPIPNPLLIEKVGGSFHIALGYTHKEADNRVGGPLHLDLTCMMLPEFGGGYIKVDGRFIQRNDKFIRPLSALNAA